jgi:hypothetical protein
MHLKKLEFTCRQLLHSVGFLTLFCVTQACTKSSETPSKAVVPSGAKVVPSGSKIVPMGTVELSGSGGPVAKPQLPTDQNKDKDKPVPTLAGLNAAAIYVPAP